jgi:hypothetical protein
MPRFVSKVEEKAEDVLEDLQREAVEEEILRELMSNAGTLSSAPVWVREETVLVNISASLTLKFERVSTCPIKIRGPLITAWKSRFKKPNWNHPLFQTQILLQTQYAMSYTMRYGSFS